MPPLRFAVLLVSLLAGPAVAQVTPPDRDAPTAAEVIERVKAAYAAAEIYADEGTSVTTAGLRGEREMQLKATTATAFVRGGLLYFAAADWHPSLLRAGRPKLTPGEESRVWSLPEDCVVDLHFEDAPKKVTNLDRALDTAAGTALLTAGLVPALLAPERFDAPHFGFLTREAELLGSEAVDGAECWVLLAGRGPRSLRLHVDRTTHFLRQITGADGPHTTLTLRPVTNPTPDDWDLPERPEPAPRDPATSPPPLPGLPEKLPDAPAVAGLVATTLETYRQLRSWADDGAAVSMIDHPVTGEKTTRTPFATRWDRTGGRFHYRYEEESGPLSFRANRYDVWLQDGRAVTSWTVRPGLEEHESLAMALAGPHGVSGGSAGVVHGLVDRPKHATPWPFWSLVNARVTAEELVNGAPCWRIDARHGDDSNLTLWLGRDDHLLHRLDQITNFDDFRSISRITWNPRANPDPTGLTFSRVPAEKD